jgi:hypothetical protein
MKDPGKILLSNWIHVLGFYLCVEITIVYVFFTQHDKGVNTIGVLLLAAPFCLLTYGLMFILGFLLMISILDLILFSFVKQKVLLILFIEWLLIVPTFIYYSFKYEYWLWIWLSAAFLITQYIRRRKIKKYLAEE